MISIEKKHFRFDGTFPPLAWNDVEDLCNNDKSDDIKVLELFNNIHLFKVSDLFRNELSRIDFLLNSWSEIGHIDARTLYIKNCYSKKVIYLSQPIIIPDIISAANFERRSTNSRIHLFNHENAFKMVRLEAIGTHIIECLRFRIALSVQYMREENETWQILRPCIIIDRKIYDSLIINNQNWKIINYLNRIISLSMHDYIHAAVMKWFSPPKIELPKYYKAILCEKPPPRSLENWHHMEKKPLPMGFGSSEFREEIEPLEFYSFVLHRKILKNIFLKDKYFKENIFIDTQSFLKCIIQSVKKLEWKKEEIIYLLTIYSRFLLGVLSKNDEKNYLLNPQYSSFIPFQENLINLLDTFHGGLFKLLETQDENILPWAGGEYSINFIAEKYLKELEMKDK